MSQQPNEFKQLSVAEWKLKVQAELAGLDYNEVLVWDTAEGLQVKPVYTQEDRNLEASQPIQTTKDWKIIGQFLNDAKQDHSYLYGFEVPDEFASKVSGLPNYLDLFFRCENPKELLKSVDFALLPNLKYLGLDVIGNFAATGNWMDSQEEDFEFAKKVQETNLFEKSLEINASLYQNAGANHVQQIAMAVSHGVEYLEKLGPEAASKIYFKTAVGGNYFFEIAKLRALRKLWKLVLAEYKQEAEPFILAETSLRNKSLLDIHNNLIRSGLEASAAIQGKADVVHVLPYDSVKSTNPFSEELASKQQLLLQKESFFDRFEDPVAGSYFVENITELFVKTALDLFQKIEKDGGFLKGLLDGSVQKMIQKAAEKEQQAFDEGKLILIGVNKFRNTADKVEKSERKLNPVRTLIQPIFPKRLAEKIENSID